MNPKYIAEYGRKMPMSIYTAESANEARDLAGKVWNMKPSQWPKITIITFGEWMQAQPANKEILPCTPNEQ